MSSDQSAGQAWRLNKGSPVVHRAVAAGKAAGFTPSLRVSNGGLDANWLDKHGIPTITIGSGQAEIHTIKEYVNLSEYEKGCRLGLLMATLAD